MYQLDQVNGLLNDGQGLQPQEVHLEQPDIFDRFFRVLGDWISVFVTRERHEVDQRFVADHDAGGVHAGIAVEAFEQFGVLHDAPQVGIHSA
jgi:hypothetical protein